MSSVLTFLDEVGEATLRNSVCFLIDSFNVFVYAEAAEEETKSCVNFIIIIPFLKLLWSLCQDQAPVGTSFKVCPFNLH